MAQKTGTPKWVALASGKTWVPIPADCPPRSFNFDHATPIWVFILGIGSYGFIWVYTRGSYGFTPWVIWVHMGLPHLAFSGVFFRIPKPEPSSPKRQRVSGAGCRSPLPPRFPRLQIETREMCS